MSVTRSTPSAFGGQGAPQARSGVFYDPALKLGLSWLEPARQTGRASRGTSALAEAVAGIVAIAAARARDAGDFAALRDAVEQALGGGAAVGEPGIDPREAEVPEPPSIRDQDPGEAVALRALMDRQSGR
jgi:hypothetical protein